MLFPAVEYPAAGIVIFRTSDCTSRCPSSVAEAHSPVACSLEHSSSKGQTPKPCLAFYKSKVIGHTMHGSSRSTSSASIFGSNTPIGQSSLKAQPQESSPHTRWHSGIHPLTAHQRWSLEWVQSGCSLPWGTQKTDWPSAAAAFVLFVAVRLLDLHVLLGQLTSRALKLYVC